MHTRLGDNGNIGKTIILQWRIAVVLISLLMAVSL